MGERTTGNEQLRDLPSGSVFDDPSTTQKAALGRVVEFNDGRKFMSVKAGATLAAGNVVSQPAASALLSNKIAVAAIGAKTIVITVAAVTLNQYQDGTLHLTDDTGEGYTYKIKSNTASDTTITVELYEGLTIAVDATTDCMLVPNLCNGVVAGIAAAKPVGVAIAVMASGEYGYVQIAGVATVSVKTTTSIAAGVKLMAGADAGVVISDGTLATIGVALGAVDAHVAADLCLG